MPTRSIDPEVLLDQIKRLYVAKGYTLPADTDDLIAEAMMLAEADENAADDEDYDDYYGCDTDDPYGPLDDGTYFADPGGNSALRAATKSNPRNLPCPTCRRPNRLTPADRRRGYQCDSCADAVERGGY
jgi:hypothetical protein